MSKIRVAYSTGTTLPIGKLKILQGDLKSLSDENFEKLKREIVDTGFAFPPHVWREPKSKQWYLVDGTQRITALKKMIEEGFKIDEIPVVVVEAKNMQEAKRRVLQATSQYGQMTQDSLVEFMNSAKLDLDFVSEKFDLPNIDMKALKSNFLVHDGKVVSVSEHQRTIGLTDDDAVPEVKKSRVKLGDIWKLGDHRLMCGDSTDKATVEAFVKTDEDTLVLSDPPYGVSVVKNNKVGADFGVAEKGSYKEVIGDDTVATAKKFYEACSSLGCFILWGGNYFTEFLHPSASWIIWNKRGDTGIKNTFADAELAWSNIGFPARVHNQLRNGMIREGEKDKRVHPTQKPVDLFVYCLNLAPNFKNVFDGFGGSGSTLIACEKTNRKCFMLELDPHYCTVIIDRWEAFTGKKAERIVEPKLRKQKRAELAAPR